MWLTKIKTFLSIALLLGLLSVNIPVTNAAFGASPPWVKNDHLLPGTTFEQVIKLSRSDTNTDMKASVRFLGEDEVNKWLTIENKDKLIIAKGEKVLPMKVTVAVPKDAELKDYKGGIFVTLESIQNESSKQGGQVAIKLGAHIAVDLNVTGTKIVDYKVKSITLDSIKGDEPFHLNIEIENKGNSEVKEIDGKVDIRNKKDGKLIKSLSFKKLKKSILPNSITQTRVDFNGLKLDTGEYLVDVEVMKDDKAVYTNRLLQIVGYALTSGANNLYAASVANSGNTANSNTKTATSNSKTAKSQTSSGGSTVTWLLVFLVLGLGGFIAYLSYTSRDQKSAVEEFYAEQNKLNK